MGKKNGPEGPCLDNHPPAGVCSLRGGVVVDKGIRPAGGGPFQARGSEEAQRLGTFPLPESQLDRFLMRISIGYPDRAAERVLLAGADRRDMVDTMLPLLSDEELAELQRQVQAIHTADPLLNYVQDLIAA
eukprot:gene46672-57158_t